MKVVEYVKNINKDKPLTIVIGENVNGEKFEVDFLKNPHAIIAGVTGTGKSVLINSIMISLMNNNTSEDVQFILVDYKMVEFTQYEGNKYLNRPIIYDYNTALKMLDEVSEEMEARFSKLQSNRLKNIDELEEKIPHLFIIFDELELYRKDKEDYLGKMCKIAQKGRAAGIHLILSSQRPIYEGISMTLLSNISLKVAFRMVTYDESIKIIGQSGAENIDRQGRALIKDSMGQINDVYIYYLNSNELDKYLE